MTVPHADARRALARFGLARFEELPTGTQLELSKLVNTLAAGMSAEDQDAIDWNIDAYRHRAQEELRKPPEERWWRSAPGEPYTRL